MLRLLGKQDNNVSLSGKESNRLTLSHPRKGVASFLGETMSNMKKILHDISTQMGMDGEINQAVITETARRISENIEKAQQITKLQQEVTKELQEQ